MLESDGNTAAAVTRDPMAGRARNMVPLQNQYEERLGESLSFTRYSSIYKTPRLIVLTRTDPILILP